MGGATPSRTRAARRTSPAKLTRGRVPSIVSGRAVSSTAEESRQGGRAVRLGVVEAHAGSLRHKQCTGTQQ